MHKEWFALPVRIVARAAFAIGGLLWVQGALLPLIERRQFAEVEHGAESSTAQVIYLCIFGFAMISTILTLRRDRSSSHVTAPFIFLFLVPIAAMLSAFWSIDPTLTLRRSVALLGATFFGLYLARTFDVSGALRLILYASLIAVTVSVIYVLAQPDLAIHHIEHPGAWRGIFIHKNRLGRSALFGLCSLLLLHLGGHLRRPFTYLVLGGCFWSVILLSQSASATVIGGAVTIGYLGYRLASREALRHRTTLLAMTIYAGVFAALGGPWLVNYVLTTLGRDITLTGRVPYWRQLVSVTSESRWLEGFGYGVFFDRFPQGEAIVGWTSGHAHNGFVQVYVDLGMVGLALLLLTLLTTISVAWRGQRGAQSAVLPIALVLLVTITNLPVSELVDHEGLSWLLLVFAVHATSNLRHRRGQSATVQATAALSNSKQGPRDT